MYLIQEEKRKVSGKGGVNSESGKRKISLEWREIKQRLGHG